MVSPGYARSPLPLEHDAKNTPVKSTGIVPMVLMQSRHNFTPRPAHMALSASRSAKMPVEVSQCTHQSQAGGSLGTPVSDPARSFLEAETCRIGVRRSGPSNFFLTATKSSGLPHGNSTASNFKLNRRA